MTCIHKIGLCYLYHFAASFVHGTLHYYLSVSVYEGLPYFYECQMLLSGSLSCVWINIYLILHIYKTFNALILGLKLYILFKGLCGGSDSKESAYNAGDPVRIPEWGRYPGAGNYVFIDEGTLFFFFFFNWDWFVTFKKFSPPVWS